MEKHIFFLKYSKDLPMEFFYLSNELSAYGVKLIPIKAQELSILMDNSKIFVINLDNTLATHAQSLRYRKQFLEYAVLNRRVVLFDISSFGKFSCSYRAESNKNYFHFPLPDTIDEISKNVAVAYFKDSQQSRLWPGGKRAKLPAN